MGAQGLTAFVITVHVPALALAAAVGALVGMIARAWSGRTQATPRWRVLPLVWAVAVAVVVYAVVCRVIDVHAIGFEAIDLVG